MEELVSVLSRSLPCREAQIRQVAECVATAGTHLVEGPPSTGKTTVIRHMLSALGVQHAYVSLASDQTPGAVLEAVLSQLGAPLPEKTRVEQPVRRRLKRKRAADEDGGPEGEGEGEDVQGEEDPEDPVQAELVAQNRARNLYISDCLRCLRELFANKAEFEGEGAGAEGAGPSTGKGGRGKQAAAPSAKKGRQVDEASGSLPRFCVVIDDLQMLHALELTARMEHIIKGLFNMVSSDLARAQARLSLIFVTSDARSVSDLRMTLGASCDRTVFFPLYSDKEVEAILKQDAGQRPGYERAVSLAVQLLYRQTQCLRKLRRYTNAAYEQYRAVDKGRNPDGAPFNEGVKRILNELKAAFGKPEIRYDLLTVDAGRGGEAGGGAGEGAGAGPSTSRAPASNSKEKRAPAARGAANPVADAPMGTTKGIAQAEGLDLSGVPVLGKFILLAGYIASKNEKGLDADLFNIGPAKYKRYRKTVKGVATADVLDMRRREAHNKAPSLFTVDRLLSIYWRMYENEGLKTEKFETEEEEEKHLTKERKLALSCSIMHEVSSLERNRLLQTIHNDGGLVGSTELRCNIPESAAQQLAHSVGVKLSQYVIYTN